MPIILFTHRNFPENQVIAVTSNDLVQPSKAKRTHDPDLLYDRFYHSWVFTQRTIGQHTIEKPEHQYFITASFTLSKRQNQSRFPSIDELIRKMWYTHTHTRIC